MRYLRLFVIGLYYFFIRNRWNMLVIFALILIAGLGLYQSILDNQAANQAWWSGMWQNFGTEVIGAIMTFILFEIIVSANSRQEALVRQMSSPDNTTAINAANELKALGYLYDGTLNRQSFFKANLSGTDLRNAQLTGANLSSANLSNVDLSGADLRATKLTKANLVGCTLDNTKLNEKTMLPDGNYWSTQTDMRRYTDPNHPNFLRNDRVAPQPQRKNWQSHHHRYIWSKRKMKL